MGKRFSKLAQICRTKLGYRHDMREAACNHRFNGNGKFRAGLIAQCELTLVANEATLNYCTLKCIYLLQLEDCQDCQYN